MYLFDTNIIIAYLAGSEKIVGLVAKAIENREFNISVVTYSEFLAKATEMEAEKLKYLTATFTPISIDPEIADLAAKYRAESLRSNKVHLLDCFIAATAKINGLTLVTSNKRDFPMKGLKIVEL